MSSIDVMGYIVFTNGLMIQWGKTKFSGATQCCTCFPMAFNHKIIIILLQNYVVPNTTEASTFVLCCDLCGFTPASKWTADCSVTGVPRSLYYTAMGY